MANRERGEVPIKIGGATYIMRFGINECCDLEEKFGKSIIELANMMAKPKLFSITMIRTLFQVGLSRSHPMEDSEAGDLLGKTDINAAMVKIGEAFEAAFPSDEGDDTNPKKGKAAVGTG